MSLKSFLLRLIGKQLPQDTVAAQRTPRSSTKSQRRSRSRPGGQWIKRQLQDYDGKRVLILRVPEGIPMPHAQSSVNGHIAKRFGRNLFTTRRFLSARTIHIQPLNA